MKRSSTRLPRIATTTAVGLLALGTLVGCGGGAATPAGSPSSSAAAEPITLKIADWGDFGLKPLIAQYQQAHPNVTITEVTGDYNTTHDNLQKYLVAGSGAPDINAVDEGYMVQFRNQATKFVNLNDVAGDMKANYIPWKWQAGIGPGDVQIGLGTDVGGLAMCYRSDLFKKAGLPTNRDEVSKLWPTWDDYIATGTKYTGASGKKFVDDAVTIMNPILGQQPVGYFSSDEKLAMDGGPKVAWDTASKAITSKISANLPQANATAWAAGFKNDSFATVACPAWMLGQIQTNADGHGTWDVADIPGGGGNWGGSWWTVPKQGKNTAAAADFVKWLVQPEQQIAVFNAVGNLPSQPKLWTDPAIADYKNPRFDDAPTGKIFTAAAAKLPDPPQYLGKKNGAVRQVVEQTLTAVEQGKFDASGGWAKALTEAQKASGA
jgi:cellobiose transport system substrate-binding protein